MLVVIGWLVVTFAVFGGYAAMGGHLSAMIQPMEFIMIAGAALGSFLVANPPKTLRATWQAMPDCFRGSKYTKGRYLALMALLYDLLQKIRKEGLMAVEADIEQPHTSALFQKHPEILADPDLVEFITDYGRLVVSGNLNPQEIDNLMESEIEAHHAEGMLPIAAIQKVSDALPAFGIVAAVMGVVHTMGSVGLPPAELGKLIAQALVGTFLGILLAYGFIGPLASLMDQKLAEVTKELQCVKVTLLASMSGYAPAIAIEFGRKVLFSTERPTFSELEAHVKQQRAGAK
jgi:chemotaxis protein MotA